MNKKFLMRKMTLARLMVLPILIVITGLSLAKQELAAVQLTKSSVLSNPRQDGGLYVAKNEPACDPCVCNSCDKTPDD
jgi:hypothetical protein